jgi:hypothetical protein
MVFLRTQSGNHAKEIAVCLNNCRWTGLFGIPRNSSQMRHASNALDVDGQENTFMAERLRSVSCRLQRAARVSGSCSRLLQERSVTCMRRIASDAGDEARLHIRPFDFFPYNPVNNTADETLTKTSAGP